MTDLTRDAQRSEPQNGPILLFDGVCNLCNAAVQWVIARDRRAQFRFASLQSRAARDVIADARGRSAVADATAPLPDSLVFVDEAGAHVRSDAAFLVARRLGAPWSMLAMLAIVPRGVRDALYDWIARNRYRWFGRQSACTVPAPALAGRFLDAGEHPILPEAESRAPRTRRPPETRRSS